MPHRHVKRKTRVYHAVNPTFRGTGRVPDAYVLVAEVDTHSLTQAFALTNHTDEDWPLNEGVRPIGDAFRSTSVGDVIVTPDNLAYLVLPIGFRFLGEF